LFDEENPELNLDLKGIFLLFKWSDNDVHRLYEDKLLKSNYTKLHYDVDESHYLVYITYPEEIMDEVNKILSGKYSTLHQDSKKVILKYWNIGQGTDLHGTLFKTKERRDKLESDLNVRLPKDAELAAIINLKDEVFVNKKQVTN
jgi:hypothetical protein